MAGVLGGNHNGEDEVGNFHGAVLYGAAVVIGV